MKMQFPIAALLIAVVLTAVGCGLNQPQTGSVGATESSPDLEPAVQKPEAIHDGEFAQRWPDGQETVYEPTGDDGKPTLGFDGQDFYPITKRGENTIELNYSFELIAHRDGHDVYRVTRQIWTEEMLDQGVGRRTKGPETSATIKFNGETVTIFDDEFGQAMIRSVTAP